MINCLVNKDGKRYILYKIKQTDDVSFEGETSDGEVISFVEDEIIIKNIKYAPESASQ